MNVCLMFFCSMRFLLNTITDFPSPFQYFMHMAISGRASYCITHAKHRALVSVMEKVVKGSGAC